MSNVELRMANEKDYNVSLYSTFAIRHSSFWVVVADGKRSSAAGERV